MWFLAQQINRSHAERSASIAELLLSTTQTLLTASTVFLIACSLLLSTQWEGERLPGLFAGILVVGLVFWAASRLMQRSLLQGIILWLAGMLLAILFGAWLLKSPGVILMASVLPLVAAITVSGAAALAVEGVLILLVIAMSRGLTGLPLPADQALLTIWASVFILIFGWVASRNLLGVVGWSLENYESKRKELEEIRDRQVALEQAQEDLNLANNELARLSQRMKVLERIAEEARQAKTEFVANVSHELRTPLNMIIGYADLISKSPQVYGGRIPMSLITDIRAILRNAQHLSTLVNDVLDLSQVEAGRMALSRSWAPLQNTIQEAMTVVKGLFESKNLHLTAEIEPNLPVLFFDETRIRQVIINLLSNAGRFTEHGGVTIVCRAEGGEVRISVQDSGPGIPEQDQERIFEPFQQANTSIRRRYGGSGLGLTISKQFVDMHGGRMWLESQPGTGTTIHFSLPLETRSLDAAGEVAYSSLKRAIIPDDQAGYHLRTRPFQAPKPTGGERYLIIDPEQTLQRLLNRYLPAAAVESAPDLPAAVELLSHSPAQALVLNTPDIAEAAQLAQLPYGTPAVTCWLPGERAAAHRLGALDYLIKPLSQEKLLATLAALEPRVKTVLIVDDEEDELNLFARHLEASEQGYSILQVTSGQRALSMLRSRHPDVMLLDLTMPGMDGFQVMEEKRRDPEICDIPVIIISSRDPSGDPIVSDTFAVTHSGGLSQRNLIACIRALSEILAPSSVQASEG